MGSCFLAKQAAKTCCITADLPVDDRQCFRYQELIEKPFHSCHFRLLWELEIFRWCACEPPVELDRTSCAVGHLILHLFFEKGVLQLFVITPVNTGRFPDK